MIRLALIVVALLPLSVKGQQAQPLRGELTASSNLRDPEFNVEVRAPGLRRQVEIWSVDPEHPGRGAWRDLVLQAGPATTLPITTHTWLAEDAAVGAQPVAPDMLALLSDWQPLCIEPAQLPENLSAVFVAVDGVLFSGDDPLAPQVGDLRIRWFRLPVGPVVGAAHWRDGAWHYGVGAALQYGLPPVDALPGLARGALPGADLLWWLVSLLLLPVAFFLVSRRSR